MVIKRPSIKPQPKSILDLPKLEYLAMLLTFLIFLTNQESFKSYKTLQILYMVSLEIFFKIIYKLKTSSNNVKTHKNKNYVNIGYHSHLLSNNLYVNQT